MVKNLPANAGDMGSIPGLGKSSGEGNSRPLQYSCLRNPMDRGDWWATVHGVTKELDTTYQLNNNNKRYRGSRNRECRGASEVQETSHDPNTLGPFL